MGLKYGLLPHLGEHAGRGKLLEGSKMAEDLTNTGPGARFWVKPESGRFETAEDLEGSMVAVTSGHVVRESRTYEEAGNEQLVFDFRFKFDQWFEQIELIGKEVLPHLR